MGEIMVEVEQAYDASAATVFAALADYATVRPTVLAPEFTDYQVVAGGVGAGTRIGYHLHATKKRVRQVAATVTEPTAGAQLLETDANSSLTVRWDVAALTESRSRVTVRVSWQGASGVGGFFERRFAPGGIRRIYRTELERLGTVLT